MPEKKNNSSESNRAYTGKTIVVPRQTANKSAEPPVLPDVPRVYQNPPPSQRAATREQKKPPPPREQKRREQRQRKKGQVQNDFATATKPRRSFWRRARRLLLVTFVLCAVLLLAGSGLIYMQARSVAASVVVPDVRSNPPLGTALIGGTTVLLVGVDERPDHLEEGVRSDTLMLARFSSLGRWVSLLSIPRDTQVNVPGVGETKINIAYGQGYARAEELYGPGTSPQQGGMALATQTVEQFLRLNERGMRIDYTAQVNFDGFVNVIDVLGGVTVDVPTTIIDYEYPTPDFGTMYVEFQPGPQCMNGATALIYARTRHADSDFGRSQRQQQVLQAIVAELQGRSWPARIALMPQLISSIEATDGGTRPVVTTLPFDRPDMLLSFAILASGLKSDSIQRVQINPEEVGLTEIGSNLIWDPVGVQTQVDRWLQGPTPPAPAPAAAPEAVGEAPPPAPGEAPPAAPAPAEPTSACR